MRNYQTLDVWKKSMELVKEIYLLTKEYPKEELFALTSQTKRSATSIPANIAEGMGRQHKKDTIHFLHIARGSVYELETHLNIALMVNIIDEQNFNTVMLLINEVTKLLSGLINYMQAKKGRDHALFIIRELLSVASLKKATKLSTALRYFSNINKHKSIAFILSDFIDANYADALRVAAARHDIVGVKIFDKMDMQLPKIGMLRIEDAETGEQKWLDTSSAYVRHEYEKEFFAQTEYCTRTFKKSGSDLLHVRTDEDYVKVLQKFFLSRNKR
ncbi:MAG: four helix bundle protein [Chitinophagaceae bacterium]|nr:MAG: four helix bundle protein [Chitinophagaceae bacterium]